MKNIFEMKFIGELKKESNIILVNNEQAIKYDIKILSNPPVNLPKDATNYLNGFSTDLKNLGFVDDINENSDERIQRLEEFLEIHYLIFKIKHKRSEGFREFYNAFDLEVVRKESSISEANTRFYPIPVLNRNSDEMQDTLEKLFNNEYVKEEFNISKEEDDYPSFLIINEKTETARDDLNQKICVFGPINKLIYSKEYGYKFITENDNTHFQYIDLKILGEFYKSNQLLFIDEKTDVEVTTMLKEGQKITIEKNKLKIEEYAEIDFIEMFKTVALEKKLSYRDEDLINFHTSMKTQGMVILAGLSGTGKSKIVHCYHEALNRFSDNLTNKNITNESSSYYPEESAKLLFVPVRPFWQDDSDLLGYLDNNNGIYKTGDSGLLDFIQEANQNKDECYIVCLDEMNLARVEHYFSQFLSVLEKDYSEDRVLNIYNEKISNRVYNSNEYNPKIPLGENIFFVGTVNLDESTFQFSDKVLDRANVITMGLSHFNDIRKNISTFNNTQHTKLDEKTKHNLGIKEPLKTFSKFKSMVRNDKNNVLKEDEVNVIWDMHNLLHDVNKQLGVGYRILVQIEKYIANLPVVESYNREKALDIQIVQRILTKVRGSKSQLEDLIGKFEDNNYQEGTIYKLLESSSISSFIESKKRVIQLAKELEEYGHTV